MPPPDADWPRPDLEAKAEFLLRLRAKGIRDLGVLRVLEGVPREFFAPRRYADLAAKDIALPIPCGQTMSEPYLVARMVESLDLRPDCRVLEIGSGSGYVTAVLARLCREVVSVERYQSLAVQARARLRDLGIANATVMWGDGLAVPPETGRFDRLIVHAVLDGLPPPLLDRLSGDAVATYATMMAPADGRQQIVRAARDEGRDLGLTVICPARLRRLDAGLSCGL